MVIDRPVVGCAANAQIRVIIADDHPLVRSGLREMLKQQPGVKAVGEAEDHASIMRELRSADYDVLVLDIGLPGRDGLAVLRLVKRDWPRLRVLVISGLPEAHFGVRALQAGADGYISKISEPEAIVGAVKAVAAGRKFVTPQLAEALVTRIGEPQAEEPHHLLSDRELATLRCIVAGRKPREIAQELSISPKTVSVYRERILQKLGLRTNAEIAAYAVRNKLFEP